VRLSTRSLGQLVALGLLAAIPGCGGGEDEPAPEVVLTAPSPGSPSTSATTTTTEAPEPKPDRPAFTFEARRLDDGLRARIEGSSWRVGCPVGLDQLRYLRVGYWDFDGRPSVGELVVASDVVADVETVFETLFDDRFPIRAMRLVDDYGGDDFASIEADNTSAFNCRPVTGSSEWSDHAYGRAIDINPIENPYVHADGGTSHPASQPYLDRSVHRPGMATPGRSLVRAFDAVGWEWGGRWQTIKDYQHFAAPQP